MSEQKKWWSVPVIVEIFGYITVEAESSSLAIEIAKERWSREGQTSVQLPTVEVDFAYGDDTNEVILEEE